MSVAIQRSRLPVSVKTVRSGEGWCAVTGRSASSGLRAGASIVGLGEPKAQKGFGPPRQCRFARSEGEPVRLDVLLAEMPALFDGDGSVEVDGVFVDLPVDGAHLDGGVEQVGEAFDGLAVR